MSDTLIAVVTKATGQGGREGEGGGVQQTISYCNHVVATYLFVFDKVEKKEK